MEKYLKGSAMRLFSFIVLCLFVVVNIGAMYGYIFEELKLSFDFITYDSMLLVSIFVPKYLQKFVENKVK